MTGGSGDNMAIATELVSTGTAEAVADVLSSYPDGLRSALMALRQIVLDTADGLEGVGPIEETLRWGQPSYVTSETGAGSTIRIAPAGPDSVHDYGMYFTCSTNLVESFRALFGDRFTYEKNRALLFKLNEAMHPDELRICIAMALTYHKSNR